MKRLRVGEDSLVVETWLIKHLNRPVSGGGWITCVKDSFLDL